jgi:pimeloyl-ACP methyl ester carboxylesterase
MRAAIMAYAEHFIGVGDGVKVYVRDYAGAGERVPVLCLHGLTRNSADFEGVAPRMVALGRRVLALDVRGRGRSDRDPKPERYRPDIYAQDVLGVLNKLDVPRAVFVGTSMGGVITMILSTTAPNRIAAAVLNDIGAEVDPRGLARIAGYVGKSGPVNSWKEMTAAVRASQSVAFPDRDEANWQILLRRLTGRPSFWDVFARRVAEELPDGRVALAYDPAIANAFKANSSAPPPTMMPLFRALAKKPVLLVRGAISDLLSPATVAAMREAKPDLEYAEVPNTGHAPTLEEPEAWNAIAAFLARVP